MTRIDQMSPRAARLSKGILAGLAMLALAGCMSENMAGVSTKSPLVDDPSALRVTIPGVLH